LHRGIQDRAFNFSYNNRDNEGTLADLGFSIASIAEVTPGGILVFFPSYWVMTKSEEVWKASGARA